MAEGGKYKHSAEKRDSVFKATTKASIIGGLQGASLSIPAHIVLHRFVPSFKYLRLPLKWAFHVIIIGASSAWKGESSVTNYKRDTNNMLRLKREKMLAEAAERGVFIEE
ncbi:hypothetical protein QEN19_000122 [Hanseniaspora menglaensis]